MDMGHWEYPGEFIVDEWFGFVYRIIHLPSKKQYIGKKQFFSRTRKKIKGRKNRKITIKESNWKTYTSSSVHVNNDIEKYGKEEFVFLIESLHKTKGSLAFAETDVQIKENVLREKFENGKNKYYNRMIAGIKFIPPDETSEETLHKIRKSLAVYWENTDHHYYNQMSAEEKQAWKEKYMLGDNNNTKRNKSKEEYKQWIIENYAGENNPMYGRTGEKSPRYGIKHTKKARKTISNKMKGRYAGEKNPGFGKHPWRYLPEERKEELRENLSERMSGEGNPMYGKPCYYKMTPEEKENWKKNIGKAGKGKKRSEETKKRMRKPKGPQKRVTCPHCKKEGGINNMTRYHFDNCKKK